VPNGVTKDDTSASERRTDARIRVVISDPVELVRQGIRRVLAGQRDIVIIGEEGASRTPELAAKLLPDVLLMGVGRIGAETLGIVDEVARQAPQCRVVLLADDATVGDLLEAVAAGAGGLLLKRVGVHHLADGVRTAAKGEWALEPRLAGELLEQLTRGGRPIPGLALEPVHSAVMGALSSREREVLLSLMQGRRNKEIAAALGVSVGTVRTHLHHIFRKLNVSDRTAAVLVALQTRTERAA
jgi:DNA-binding NarL/FixJ family response regulator